MKYRTWRRYIRPNIMKIETGNTISKLAIANIQFETKMCQKISSRNWERNASNYENPLITTAKSHIQGHGFFTENRDGGLANSLKSK